MSTIFTSVSWLTERWQSVRVTGSGEGTKNAFQVFSLKGQYDTQAIGKTTLLFLGGYEAETTVATVAGLAVGDFLVVSDVSISAVNKRGLIKAAGAGQHLVVAMVTRVIGTTKVRFWHQGAFQITI